MLEPERDDAAIRSLCRACTLVAFLGPIVSFALMFVVFRIFGADLDSGVPEGPGPADHSAAFFIFGKQHPGTEDVLCACALLVWLAMVLPLVTRTWRCARSWDRRGRPIYATKQRTVGAVVILPFVFMLWFIGAVSWETDFLRNVVFYYNVVPYAMGWFATVGIIQSFLMLAARTGPGEAP